MMHKRILTQKFSRKLKSFKTEDDVPACKLKKGDFQIVTMGEKKIFFFAQICKNEYGKTRNSDEKEGRWLPQRPQNISTVNR